MVEENLYSGRSEAEQASNLEQVLAQLARPAKEEFQDKDLHALHFYNHLEQKEFEEMVALARDYIRKGDMFQCVLSQRFSADFSGKPLDYYRNLRVTNPSNYLYFYDFWGVPNYRCQSRKSGVSQGSSGDDQSPLLAHVPEGSMKRLIGNWQLIWQGIQKKSQNTGCWWI